MKKITKTIISILIILIMMLNFTMVLAAPPEKPNGENGTPLEKPSGETIENQNERN